MELETIISKKMEELNDKMGTIEKNTINMIKTQNESRKELKEVVEEAKQEEEKSEQDEFAENTNVSKF